MADADHIEILLISSERNWLIFAVIEEKPIVGLGSTHKSDNRTLEGYLCKQGALLKGWKARWFVLDFMKHQIRYYDEKDDSHCRGFIDLAEVISVALTKPSQAAPKKAHDNVFFEMRTIKRTYVFLAESEEMAQTWTDTIQSRISS